MNTLEKLQAKLNYPSKEIMPLFFHKDRAEVTVCGDGTSLSIQASEYHYSTPRDNTGPYTEVEVWCVKATDGTSVTEFDYDEDEPSAYVPIEQVAAFIDRHGGFVK